MATDLMISPWSSQQSQRPLYLSQVMVIIPVYNEAATIATVIHTLQAQGLTQIRVVDNGSDDNSGEIAARAWATVVREPVAGYGQACWRGLQDIPTEIEWILFCDGDGSDDLSQLPKFWDATTDAEFILANRRATKSSRAKLTPPQNFGNGLAVRLMQWGWGYCYHDLGPLRLIRRSVLDAIQMQDRAFGWTVEMQVRALELGLRIQEIETTYGDRLGGQSKISGTLQGVCKAGYGILTTLGKFYGQKVWRDWQRLPSQLGLVGWLAAVLLLVGSGLVGFYGRLHAPESFQLFIGGISLMLAGFGLSAFQMGFPPGWFWAIAISCRALLLASPPSSTDIWRYLWEGLLQLKAINPYQFAPNDSLLAPLRTEWWSQINHPDIAAIYPPIAQWGFRLLASIDPAVWVFKLGFVAVDLLVLALLAQRFGCRRAAFYGWNPLVMFVFAGDAHYDSWFILPLVLTWFAVDRQQWRWGAFWLGVSVGVKLISLPILGFILAKNRLKCWPSLILIAALPILLTVPSFCTPDYCSFIPWRSSFVNNARSADLIPYFINFIPPEDAVNNRYFFLPILLLTGLWIVMCRRFLTFIRAYWLTLFCFSPVVHSWYFAWLIPFGVVEFNWGIALLSASAFVYFLLPYRQLSGQEALPWFLTNLERFLLWCPFVGGFAWSAWRQSFSPIASTPTQQREVS